MKVEKVCTTDEPVDNLKYHIEYRKSDNYTKMSPTFRPDKFIHIQNVNYNKYLNDLETSAMILSLLPKLTEPRHNITSNFWSVL